MEETKLQKGEELSNESEGSTREVKAVMSSGHDASRFLSQLEKYTHAARSVHKSHG
jgi:hypothetical protein